MNRAGWQERERWLDEATDAVHRLAGTSPRPLVVVTGSGLAGLASLLSVERRIPFAAIPHFPRPTVTGHPGSLLIGRIGRSGAVCFAGRVHLYEGYGPEDTVFSIDLAHRLGGRMLLITNASGGVNPLLQPGDLVLLTSHLDLTFRNPLVGLRGGNAAGSRPAAGADLYDPALCDWMREAARREKIDLKEGVYAGTVGPSYETRAESAMLRGMGADAVGMSTVPEVIAARWAGLRVVAISCIANRVPVWGRTFPVTHAEVVERMREAGERLKRLAIRWIELVEDDASR